MADLSSTEGVRLRFSSSSLAEDTSPKSKAPLSPPEMFVDVENQSRIVDEVLRIRTGHLSVDGQPIPDRFYPEVLTCWDAFLRGRRQSVDGRCYGVYSAEADDWVYESFDDIHRRVLNVGSALVTLGLSQSGDTSLGIYAKNCLEWNLLEYTCYANSMMVTPLYDTFGKGAVINIINETEMAFVFIDDEAKLTTLLERRAELPHLKFVATKFFASAEVVAAAASPSDGSNPLCIINFADLESLGAANPRPVKPPQKDDVAVLMYTSGTTGMPKGAMLTHDNIMFTSQMWYFQINKGPHGHLAIGPDHCILTCLPKAHLLALCTELHVTMAGGRVALFRGDIKQLLSDIARVQPTAFPMVPALLNRIYNRVMDQLNQGGWIKRKVFEMALAWKLSWYSRGYISNDTWVDYFIFSKIQKLLGGKLRLLVTGSAPIDRKVLAFARGVMGCYVFEAYGQTETSGANVISLPTDCRSDGHVGTPLPNLFVKLVDVPEMDYYKDQDQGEICMKGRCNFKGYLKRPEITADTIDADGWVHTGDIGQWLPNGALKIIDRKKNIFKLMQGEYVAPEKVEQIYGLSPWVDQAFIEGKSTESFCVAVIVVNQEYLASWAGNNGFDAGAVEKLVEEEAVRKALLEQLQRLGKERGLNGFEQAKKVHLRLDPFSVDNGLLTPTLKLKRVALRKEFASVIEAMYRS